MNGSKIWSLPAEETDDELVFTNSEQTNNELTNSVPVSVGDANQLSFTSSFCVANLWNLLICCKCHSLWVQKQFLPISSALIPLFANTADTNMLTLN